MRLLVPREGEEDSDYQSVVSAKRGDRRVRLRQLWQIVNRRYDEYILSLPDLENLGSGNFSKAESADLKHCYDMPSKALGQLKSKIIAALPEDRDFYCQYCQISEWDALDHYVPKDGYPEFSILARNLIPSCTVCNREKGTTFLENGKRVILNLYYDDFPDEQYLFVDVDFPATGGAIVRFELRPGQSIPNELFQHLCNHYKELELLDRLTGATIQLISENLLAAKNFESPINFCTILGEQAIALKRKFGPNFWKAIVFETLSTSCSFVECASRQ